MAGHTGPWVTGPARARVARLLPAAPAGHSLPCPGPPCCPGTAGSTAACPSALWPATLPSLATTRWVGLRLPPRARVGFVVRAGGGQQVGWVVVAVPAPLCLLAFNARWARQTAGGSPQHPPPAQPPFPHLPPLTPVLTPTAAPSPAPLHRPTRCACGSSAPGWRWHLLRWPCTSCAPSRCACMCRHQGAGGGVSWGAGPRHTTARHTSSAAQPSLCLALPQ